MWLAMACVVFFLAGIVTGHAREIDFATEVRPILSDKCFLCHGPAEASREADLRLDLEESASEDRGGYAAIVPGDADASEAIQRIIADDESLLMPPPESGKSLTAEEIKTLKAWVREGAGWSDHWAFVTPQRPGIPTVPSDSPRGWSENPIDAFVLKLLSDVGRKPSSAAPAATRLRRLHFDLVGLPPTLAEREAFLDDTSYDAYVAHVDSLLASPHYGERWGRHWLDAARYSDSDGYEKDMRRDNWFYRDWVIDAVNADMPYDDFVIAQIAGDLLPDAGQAERIATGFLRNSMVNEEGGADPEQFRIEGLFDRMDAIGKAVLGLTTQCAQCHTHKYDPLTHHDYFGLFAYLNSDNEAIIAAYTLEEQRTIDSLRADVDAIESELKRSMPDWRSELIAWAEQRRESVDPWTVLTAERATFTGQKFAFLPDGSILSQSYAPARESEGFFIEPPAGVVHAIRLELLNHPDLPRGGPGRSIYGTNALSEFTVELVEPNGNAKPVAIASATADLNVGERPIGVPFVKELGTDERTVGPIALAIDGDAATAWTTLCDPADRNQPRKAVFVLAEPLEVAEGMRLRLTLKQEHGGFVGNQKNNSVAGRFRFSVTPRENVVADAFPARVRSLVQRGVAEWGDDEWTTVFSYWRSTHPEWREANEQIAALRADFPEGTNQYVIAQRATPRVTRRMDRGDFLSPDELVEPHTPGFLHTASDDLPPNRLGLATWLVDRRSPTTARAIVNRVWQAYFGIGLVETAEDLGSQAPPPSHPKLLDWLAVEFMDSGWSLKRLHRLIVTSATYQQHSKQVATAAETDSYNRLLWRGPRGRVDAEVVRDAALAASGLLDRTLGGPSVYPPAPKFLFLPPSSYGVKPWKIAAGDANYRRSLYVQAYRSSPYPPLQLFDAPNGESSCVRRTRSNTPLQALTLLNEQQFVTCSRSLAERLTADPDASDQDRITTCYRLLLTRDPQAEEIDIVQAFLNECRARLAAGELDPAKIIGESPEGSGENREELAAWTLTARCLLNLDETITKQ